MLVLLALLLAQQEPTEAELDRLVAEHKGLLLEIAKEPTLEAAKEKVAKAKKAAMDFAEGPCLCGASKHTECTDKKTCDPAEAKIKDDLLKAYTTAADHMRGMERRLARRAVIAKALSVAPEVYELRKVDIDEALKRLRHSRDHWKTANEQIDEIRADVNRDVKEALKAAEHARFKAWTDAVLDILGAVVASPEISKALSTEQQRALAEAAHSFAGLVRDIWDQVVRPGEPVRMTELLKNVGDTVSTMRGVFASMGNDAGAKTLRATNVIYTIITTAAAGDEKTLGTPEFKARLGEGADAIGAVVATAFPTAAVIHAGSRTVQAVFVSVKLHDSIADMRAAIETTAENATIAERRLRAVERRIACYEHQRPHASD